MKSLNYQHAFGITKFYEKTTLILIILVSSINLNAQLAFPTASGGGAYVSGGRGGNVIHVTNLNNSGPGSFREAFTTPGPRIIVFDVSGTINVTSSLSTAYDDVIVAGQSAPEGGITFTGNLGNSPIFEISGRDNMIFRHIRVRPVFFSGGSNADSFQCYSCTNVIVDHCSVSWGGDECLSFTGTTSNITIQNSIIAESKTGSIIGNPSNPGNAQNLSMLGNLFFQIGHRHPNTPTNGRADIINNVIYGYRYRINRPANGYPRLNEINNYYITDTGRPLGEMNKIDKESINPQIFSKGNLHLPNTVTDPNLPNNNDTWTAFGTSNGAYAFNYNGVNYYDDDPAPDDFFTSVQHPLVGHDWNILTALESLEHAKTDVGANKTLEESGNAITNWDAIDDFYISHVNNGTLLTVNSGITMAGKPHYENFLNNISTTPINTRPANYDTDNDGMADLWENNTFGDLTKTASGDEDGDGYTNIEEFLNGTDTESNITFQVEAGDDLAICQGETITLTASDADSYVWTPGNITGESINVSPTTTTTYTVTGTHSDGSTTTDSIVITVNSIPVANAGQDVETCQGTAVILSASGGTSYLWNTGATTQSISVNPNTTTTYSVEVTENGCTSDFDEVIVTVNPLPSVDAGLDVTINYGESTILTATGADSYIWSTGATTESITVNPTIETTYTVTGTTGTCQNTDAVTVFLIGSEVVANAGEDQTICDGLETTLTATGGAAYVWNTGETTANITVSPNTTTTYTVTAFDSTGTVSDTDDVIVTVTDNPIANAGNDVEICQGATVTLTASGGSNYIWNTGETSQSITVSPNTSTTYSVEVIENNCSNIDEVLVIVNALPNIDAGIDVSINEGETTTLTASGADTYLWSTGESTASIDVNPTITTTYSVTGFSNGCEATDELIVFVETESVIANAGSDVSICEGESTILTASGGTTYLWSTGETTSSIEVNPNVTTTYSVTVFNSLETSSDSDEVIVTVNALPNIDAGIDVSITEGETTTLTASGADTYMWSTGDTTASIDVNPTSTTTYSVTGFSNGCEATDELIVFVETESVIANAGADVSICEGESTILTASGGTTYQWSTGETSSSIEVSPNVTTTYSVTVFNSLETSSDTDDVIVTVNAIPIANAGNDIELCQGASVTLTASGGSNYIWNTGETSQSITVSPNATTTYSVEVIQNNCSSTDEVTVIVNDLPNVSAGSNVTITEGESTTLSASGAESYSWSTGETSQTIEVSPNTTTTYTVTGFSNGCEAADEVTVIVEPIVFVANAGEDQFICQGTSTILTVSEGDSYIWSTGETTQSITVSPWATETYTVTVFEGNEQAQDDVTVNVNLNPNVVIMNGGEVTILEGEFITLSASGANTYEWNNGATQPNIAVSPSVSTTYSVTGYINNCSDEKSVTVNVVEAVEAYAGEDLTICSNEMVTLTAIGGEEYLWNTGETSQSINVAPGTDTEYSVLVYNALSSDEASVTVYVNDCSSVEIPQVDQEFNVLIYQEATADVLKVKISGMDRVDVDQIMIYDITGKIIYKEQIKTDENTQSLDKEIDSTQFSRGIYIVRLLYDDTELLKKIPIR